MESGDEESAGGYDAPMRAMLSFLLLSVGASSATAQPGPGVPLPEGTKVLKDLAYVEGGHERQKLDLYLPRRARLPLVVSIHGGAFRMGSKDGGRPARRGSSRRATPWPPSTTG